MSDNKVTPSIASVEEVVRELRDLLDRAAHHWGAHAEAYPVWIGDLRPVQEAIALLSALEKDAGRYRWLRERGPMDDITVEQSSGTVWHLNGCTLDTAIDLARGQS